MSQLTERALRPEDLFALEFIHDARLSPDGRRLAYVTSRTEADTAQEYFEIVIEESGSGQRSRVGFTGRATFPRWSPDGTRLAFIGAAAGAQRLYVAEVSAQRFDPLTSADCEVQGPPAWSPDGSSIVYSAITRFNPDSIRTTKRIFRAETLGRIDDRISSLHVVDVASRTTHPLNVSMGSVLQPSFSPCGRRVLFLGSDAAIGRAGYGGLELYALDRADGRVSSLLTEGWSIATAAWSPCGERIVVVASRETRLAVPTMGVWVVNADGSEPQCRTESVLGNVGMRAHHDMPTWDTSQNNNILCVPDDAYAYATVAARGCTEIWRIALTGEPRCEPIVSGARSCVIMDANARKSRLLYCASDLHRPWDLCESDLNGAHERRLTRLNDAVLARWPAMRVEHLSFNSADGLPLEGWYLSRADREGPQPTVMFIHGGPFLATGHAFRFDFHLLAANGYAVVFANFRGSAGYGEPFAQAIVGDWGARGFPDHMATVDAAIARGLADATRLGVWGASHGGFATCWIVGHTTRFRAALAESSVTNYVTLYYLCDAPDMFARDLGGRPHEIPDVYRARSPLTYAWRCRTPTLMLHGEQDLRCPVAEAEQFYRALHDVNCPTELVRIPAMNHMGDSTGPLAARRAQNEALLEWFERHL
jgi:dipeptidyl aminopeptidase/acylaminoacyl peptidase